MEVDGGATGADADHHTGAERAKNDSNSTDSEQLTACETFCLKIRQLLRVTKRTLRMTIPAKTFKLSLTS